ncbi:hypothetical protein D3C71_2066840 [compost metagenome]
MKDEDSPISVFAAFPVLVEHLTVREGDRDGSSIPVAVQPELIVDGGNSTNLMSAPDWVQAVSHDRR